MTVGVAIGGFLVGSGAGLFTDPWPVAAELERRFRAASPALTVIDGDRVWPVAFTSRTERRSDAVWRVSALRPMAWGRLGIEQTWTSGRHLAGLTRELVDGDLVDRLTSSRSMSRSVTHLRLDTALRSWTFTAHYTLANSYDDADGMLAWPAVETDLGAEWAPSSAVPRQTFTAVVSGSPGYGVQLLLTAEVTSGLPYSLITGLDPEGLFTFSGRAGRLRNQQRQPAAGDISIFASRPFRLPVRGLTIDTGMRVENLLGTVTPFDVERLASSPSPGRVLSAGPGRSMSVWATFGRR